MGNKCSWVAARDLSLGEVLLELELGVTGERSDDVGDGLSAIETIEDWIVVLAFGADSIDGVEEANARALSVDSWALFFRSEGGASQLIEYRDGARTWAIRHGHASLEVSGALPEALSELVDEIKEVGGDLGELPARIGQKLTGFRHDRPVKGADDDDPVQELEAR